MIQADVKLDTLGYFCPMPIIMTSKKIKELTTIYKAYVKKTK